MPSIALQFWASSPPADWVVAYGQLTDILSALIGLIIAYYAFRGYRRNDSRPMLFISVGFILALAVPFLLLVLYLAVPGLSEAPVALATQTSQVVGLISILWALRMPA